MGQWKKTTCVLCAQTCGVEVFVEEGRMVKVRPDKENPRSEGYICRKGMNLLHHQYNEDRLTTPLKRVGDAFVSVSWDEALSEIAQKLGTIVENHGPRSFAYMGGAGVGCNFEMPFAVAFLNAMGSPWLYTPLAQEFSGYFGVQGWVTGSQEVLLEPDIENCDMLLAVGWNGMESHQVPQARKVLTRLSKDPDKLLVVIDPRKSETAVIADIHLAIRPGTDALLTKAMIAILLEENLEDAAFIQDKTSGFEEIKGWFKGFDIKGALAVCELDEESVRKVVRLFVSRTSCTRPDLGVFMNRHSTLTSYLHVLFWALSGRIGRKGGQIIPGVMAPLGRNTPWDDPANEKTPVSGFPATCGCYPPAALPEEILSENEDRIRALYVSTSNPLRSYPDTTAYEKAFESLDLLVTTELAFTETAALSHYVLPSRTGYESHDGTIFAYNFPEIYFNLRRPVVEPRGQGLEAAEILCRLAQKMNLLPALPESLMEAAETDRQLYLMELFGLLGAHPEAMDLMPLILGASLGRAMGSPVKSVVWGMLHILEEPTKSDILRQGYSDGPELGETLFQAIMDHPEGLFIGKTDGYEKNLERLKTEDKRLRLSMPMLEDHAKALTPESEAEALVLDAAFPLSLQAGRHFSKNANTLMRNPAWNKTEACTLLIHPMDAETLNIKGGQTVKIETRAGFETLPAEISEATRKGQVVMPHGFGLVFNGKKHGANVNRLTPAQNRDPIIGTPLHRFVPCRVTPERSNAC